ncbi:hypothetical protein ACOMHN_016635 [Nucella lapillus]
MLKSTPFSEVTTDQASDFVNLSAKDTNASNASNSADFMNAITSMLWYIVPPFLLVWGTFGNVMIVVVMRGLRASQSTACLSVYFTALAVSDQCLLTMFSLWFWTDKVFSWPPSFFYFNLLCTLPKFVWYSCSPASAWFLVAMTYQRVTSVVAPHRVGVLCTVNRGKIIIATIAIVALVTNFHTVFTFAYRYESKGCLPRLKYMEFIYIFTWLDLLWSSAIPFVLLLVGNSILIHHVIKSISLSRQMRGNVNKQTTSAVSKVYPMTITLILTSAVFIVLTLPICVFDVYRRMFNFDDASDNVRAELYLTRAVTQFLWMTTSASNFYLYMLSGSKFRQIAKECLCLPCAQVMN